MEQTITRLQHELADAYLELATLLRRRKVGRRAGNLQKCIQYFEEAQKLFDPNVDSDKWLRCSVGVCMSSLAPPIDNVQKAIQHGTKALRLCERASFPGLWHTLHLYLAIAFTKKGGTEDMQVAEDHRKLAFDFDHAKLPSLFSNLARIHSIHLDVSEIVSKLSSYTSESVTEELP